MAAVTAGAGAQDELQLDGMAVVGNRELPKALFIVPWKAPEAAMAPMRKSWNSALVRTHCRKLSAGIMIASNAVSACALAGARVPRNAHIILTRQVSPPWAW